MMKPGRKPRPEEYRFFEKVEITGSCWLWTARLNAAGYGTFKRADGSNWLAHRWAWQFFLRSAPPPVLDHVCRTRRCVNPDHLESVTRRENSLRGMMGNLKTHCVNGHSLSGDNLMIERWNGPRTARRCKTCHSAKVRRYRLKVNA